MIETKDATELFERLEREMAEERQLMHAAQRDLAEVKRLVPPEVSRPSMLRRIMPAFIAVIVSAAIGVGVGMAIQYQQTQDVRDEVTLAESTIAHMGSVALLDMPSAAARTAEAQALATLKANQITLSEAQAARFEALYIDAPSYAGDADTAVREGAMYIVNGIDEKAAPYGRGPVKRGQQP